MSTKASVKLTDGSPVKIRPEDFYMLRLTREAFQVFTSISGFKVLDWQSKGFSNEVYFLHIDQKEKIVSFEWQLEKQPHQLDSFEADGQSPLALIIQASDAMRPLFPEEKKVMEEQVPWYKKYWWVWILVGWIFLNNLKSPPQQGGS